MLPSPELQLLVSALALAAIGAAWLLSILLSDHRLTTVGSIVGGIGAGVAALGIAAVLNPVTGIDAKGVLGMWMLSLGMIVVAIVLVAVPPSRTRWFLVASGVVCLLLNLWAIALFLWIATVSPGGV